MDQKKIGRFIGEMRRERELTQEALAERLGVSGRTVSRWETGRNMPDYSVLKELCDALGVSVNELLEGERIERDRRAEESERQIIGILKDYKRLKRQRQIALTVLIALGVLTAAVLTRAAVWAGLFTLARSGPRDERSGIEAFDKAYYRATYGGDLDSDLSVFPDGDLSRLIEPTFFSSLKAGLFDTDGCILLRAGFGEEDFQAELRRLGAIRKTVVQGEQTWTNEIRYDEDSYPKPAFVAVDGFRSTWEYALVDRDAREIVYVWLAYPSEDDPVYAGFLKRDRGVYSGGSRTEAFSLYNHSFDGGKTWAEFDD